MALAGSEKTKWIRLKGEIIKRPFLAYKIGLTPSEIENYFSGLIPTSEKIKEIDQLLLIERQKKVDRIRPVLTRVVGHRGSVQFAQKIGANGMTIKYIIDNKSIKVPSHDLISKIENYLSYITDFEVSIENLNDQKVFVPNKIDNLKLSVLSIISQLNNLSSYFDNLKSLDKNLKKGFLHGRAEEWKINQLKYVLANSINELERIQFEVGMLIENCCD